MGDAAALVPLLLALPLLGAALTRLPGISRRRGVPDVIGATAAMATAVVGGIVAARSMDGPLVHHLGGWAPVDRLPIGIPLVADPLAAGFVTLFALLTAAVYLHLAAAGARAGGLTHVLTALLLAAGNGFVLAGDLFTMFVFIELLGITVYAITAGKTDDPIALPAALNMAVTSTVGAVFLLSGVGLLHGQLGTPSLALLAERLATAPADAGLGLALGLIVTGLAVKAGLAPFHFAHADLHTATTVQHAGLFGALLLPLGVYGVARVHVVAMAGDGSVAGPVAWVLIVAGTATAVTAAVMTLCQNHLKRLLAFSSVAHVGIVAAGFGLSSARATAGTTLYVLGHAPVKLGLMLVAGLVLHRLGALDVTELAGRWRQVPTATVLLAVGGLALAGLPPSGLFAGKALLAEAAESAGRYPVVTVLYLAAATTGAAVLRVVVHLVAGWPVPPDPDGHVAEDHGAGHQDGPRTLVWLPALLIAAGVLVPILPGVEGAAAAAGVQFQDQQAYAAAVLDGERSRPVVEPVSPWKRASLATGTLAALAALVGGVVAARLRGRRAPGRLGAPIRALRGLHTGHVGDYTAWLSVGAAGIVTWLLVSVQVVMWP